MRSTSLLQKYWPSVARQLLLLFLIAYTWDAACLPLRADVPGDDNGFTEDVAAALVDAKENNKDLLVLFTGSDWCPPCKKWEAEVFSQAEFLDTASTSFALIKLDFPNEIKQKDELKERNREWQERFGITGYPTVVVMDVEQRPIGFVAYLEGGPQPFLDVINELQQKRVRRDLALAKLPQAQNDDEKAMILDEALGSLELELVKVYYADELAEIDRIDEDNHLGLRNKYFEERDAEARKIIMTDIEIMAEYEEPAKTIAFIDEVLGAIPFPNDEQFAINEIKLGLLQEMGDVEAFSQQIDHMASIEGMIEETRERLIVRKLLFLESIGRTDEVTRSIETELAKPGDHFLLKLAKAQLMIKSEQKEEALGLLSDVLPKTRINPDVMIEFVGAVADLQYGLNRAEDAMKTLDNFADDAQMPVDLRCEALLHQAMIMRDMGRLRPAMLVENRAVELADTTSLKREIQLVVERIRSGE
ncbi:MAG: thioredoxin family protein [Pirellulaceae bacterium]